MKSMLYIVVALFLSACATVPLQDSRISRAKARIAAEDLARLEFSTGRFDVLMDQMIEATLVSMRPVLEEELGRELTHTENRKVTSALRDVLVEVYPEKDWLEGVSEVYYRHFTAEEIESILKFYQSSPGKRLLDKQAIITSEAIKSGERLFESKQDTFAKRLQQELAKALPSLTADLTSNIEDARVLNISETIKACQAIQASRDVPISCAFDYLEGRPSMVVGFRDLESATTYWKAMSDKVAGPFCQAANLANRQAMVFVTLVDSEMASMYSCESGQWSEWVSISESKSF